MIDPNHPNVDDQIDIEDAIDGAQPGAEGEDSLPPRPTVGEEITPKEIWAWCDYYAARGEPEVSARTIRRERGGSGSPTGIQKHIDSWRAKRDKKASASTKAEKPGATNTDAKPANWTPAVVADLPLVAPAVEGLVRAILAQASDLVQTERDKAHRDQAAIRADADRQIAEIRAGAEASIASLRTEHEAAMARKQHDLDEALAMAQEDGERADGLEKAINGPDGYVAQIKTRDDEIATLKAEIERLKPFEPQAAALAQNVADLGEHLAAEEKARQTAEGREADARADAEKQRGIADTLRDRLDAANAAAAEATTRAATAEGKASGLETALASAERLAADREKEINRLSADLERVRSERDAMRPPAQAEQPVAAPPAEAKTTRRGKRADTTTAPGTAE